MFKNCHKRQVIKICYRVFNPYFFFYFSYILLQLTNHLSISIKKQPRSEIKKKQNGSNEVQTDIPSLRIRPWTPE